MCNCIHELLNVFEGSAQREHTIHVAIQNLSFTEVLVAQPCHTSYYVVNLIANIRNFDYVTAIQVLPGQCFP